MPFKITKNKELICFNSDKDFEDYAVCPCATLDLHGQYSDNYLQAVDEGAKFIIMYGADESAITKHGVITKRVLLPKEVGTPRKDMLVQLSAKNIVKTGASRYTSLTFYQGITTIKRIPFMRYNYLISISIPNSVTYIEKGAFRNLDPLEGITFHGSKEEWNAIDKKEDWCLHTNPILVHCTDGDIEI
jgi:hypothetical protein